MNAQLVLLGKTPSDTDARLVQPQNLRIGDVIPLAVAHGERWRREDVTRVIVGSNHERADVLLVDKPLSIGGEQVRFYLNNQNPSASEIRPVKASPVMLNGAALQEFEWATIKDGDEIQMSCWRFKIEFVK